MMFAPVFQSLADFICLHSGAHVQTLSLSNIPLVDDMRGDSSYFVNTRGSDAYGTSLLYDSILWAEETHYVNYTLGGEMVLAAIGNLSEPTLPDRDGDSLVSFGMAADLIKVETTLAGNPIKFLTTFHAQEPVAENVTLFFHLLDASGQLIAQADGDSLHGLIRLRAWPEGNVIDNIRTLRVSMEIDNQSLQLLIGFYDRIGGARLPANRAGFQIRDDDLVIPEG